LRGGCSFGAETVATATGSLLVTGSVRHGGEQHIAHLIEVFLAEHQRQPHIDRRRDERVCNGQLDRRGGVLPGAVVTAVVLGAEKAHGESTPLGVGEEGLDALVVEAEEVELQRVRHRAHALVVGRDGHVLAAGEALNNARVALVVRGDASSFMRSE